MVMFIPFLKALRKAYPNSHIVGVFTKPNGSEEILKIIEPTLIDKIIFTRHGKRGKYVQLIISLVQLLSKRWDLLIFRYNSISLELIITAIITRTKSVVGYGSNEDYYNKYNFILTKHVEFIRTEHEVLRYRRLANSLHILEYWPKNDNKCRNHTTSSFENKSIAIIPGSSENQKWKRWPLEHWKSLVLELIDQNFTIYLLGSKIERELGDEILKNINSKKIKNHIGSMTLKESIEIIRSSKLVICNDSSMLHIAHYFSVPTIAIFGPTNHQLTGYNDENTSIVRSVNCKGDCYRFSHSSMPICSRFKLCLHEVTPQQLIKIINHKI